MLYLGYEPLSETEEKKYSKHQFLELERTWKVVLIIKVSWDLPKTMRS